MTLILEDGTGQVVGANAYVDVQYVTDYLALQGRETEWAALDTAEQEAAIIRATHYIDLYNLISVRLYADQPLEFPRYHIYLRCVPVRVKRACAEFALVSTTESLIQYSETANIKKKKEKVDVIEEETEYRDKYIGGLPNGESMKIHLDGYILIEPYIDNSSLRILLK